MEQQLEQQMKSHMGPNNFGQLDGPPGRFTMDDHRAMQMRQGGMHSNMMGNLDRRMSDNFGKQYSP